MVVASGWGEGEMRSYGLMSTELQFGKVRAVLGTDGGDGCTMT